MSTSDKLTYLNETKQELKTAINNLGGDIDNETTFREYAQELEDIYTSLPKVTDEGTEVTLTPTKKGKLSLGIKGNTEQKTNLFNNDIEQGAISEGSDVTATNRIRTKEYIEVIPNTSIPINFSGCDDWYVSLFNSSKTYVSGIGWQPKGNSVSIPSNIYYIRIAFRKSDNSNITPTSISNVQIGDIPNPNYEQPIKSVTGENEVVVKNSDNTLSQTLPLNLGTKKVMSTDYIESGSIKHKRKQVTLGNMTAHGIRTATIFGVSVKYATYSFSDMKNGNQEYNFYCTKVSKANGVANKYSGYTLYGNFIVIVDDNDTVETVNAKLSDAIFEYELAQEETETLTEEQINQLNAIDNMKSYEGTTIITSTYEQGNAQMIINASALKKGSE